MEIRRVRAKQNMTRSSSAQAKLRRECYKEHHRCDESGVYMFCHICDCRINCTVEGWEADHVIADAFGGKKVEPAHIKCHRKKTSEQDIPAIAKAKRVSDKYTGIRRKGWGGKFKKKMSGEVVER